MTGSHLSPVRQLTRSSLSRLIVGLSLVFAVLPGYAQEPVAELFSVHNTPEQNRQAVVGRFEDWTRGYAVDECVFGSYQGLAKPAFFLRLFLGARLEAELRFAECRNGDGRASLILVDVRSSSRERQRFTIGVKSVFRPGESSPFSSESTYASKGSFIESSETIESTRAKYRVHHRYRKKPAQRESGEIRIPDQLADRAHNYASLMSHLSELVGPEEEFRFVLTDPYSAAIQDELVHYPMWRNEPVQEIEARRNADNSISMRGWFTYAFGQLKAEIEVCVGDSRTPEVILYRHPFMDVDLWKSSAANPDLCIPDEKRQKQYDNPFDPLRAK